MTLLETLQSCPLGECLQAIEELGARTTPAPAELQALAHCLGDQRRLVQRSAAQALAALGRRSSGVAALLSEALRSANDRQRWGAAYACSLTGALPVAARPVLLETLGAVDADMRWAAADILSHGPNDPELVDGLVGLLHTGNALQRKMAAYCLRDRGAWLPAVEHAIVAALHDMDSGVRLAAISSLAHLSAGRAAVSDHLIPLLCDTQEGVRRAAAAALGELGQDTERVVTALRDAARSSDPSLRRAAERSLRRLRRSDQIPGVSR